ncbi:unnamed protein product [Ceratitis capitata]|uniref:(Mediterranean fruit fly) hypothetical protein n=1 Tax=Ceratitis capitata TaxID=7213 RepID=A0A811V8F9_CERCA|nr:unnamed protein product [Ceratitis capitata]
MNQKVKKRKQKHKSLRRQHLSSGRNYERKLRDDGECGRLTPLESAAVCRAFWVDIVVNIRERRSTHKYRTHVASTASNLKKEKKKKKKKNNSYHKKLIKYKNKQLYSSKGNVESNI